MENPLVPTWWDVTLAGLLVALVVVIVLVVGVLLRLRPITSAALQLRAGYRRLRGRRG